jgi:cob(I)alamin adenosyltransferase
VLFQIQELDMGNRITTEYKPGKGDLGYSEIMHGLVLRKDHPACEVQGAFEEVRSAIESVLVLDPTVQDCNLKDVLIYIDRNIFSLGSFCYKKGDSSRHVLPESLLNFLNQETERLKQTLGNCPDFVGYSHPLLVALDRCRVEVRKAERRYNAWRFCDEMTTHVVYNNHLEGNICLHAAILNRLSAYLFEATRQEAMFLVATGLNAEPRVWQSEVEPFCTTSI